MAAVLESQLNQKLLVDFKTTVCAKGMPGKNLSADVGIIEPRVGVDEDEEDYDEEPVKEDILISLCMNQVSLSGGRCVL